MNIFVVDKNGVPVCSVSEQEAGRTAKADMSGGHSVVISSEEQFKVFSLPTLRPRNKEKLTAVDGSRVRKLGIVDVAAKTAGETFQSMYSEHVTNFVYSHQILYFTRLRPDWISYEQKYYLSQYSILRFLIVRISFISVK